MDILKWKNRIFPQISLNLTAMNSCIIKCLNNILKTMNDIDYELLYIIIILENLSKIKISICRVTLEKLIIFGSNDSNVIGKLSRFIFLNLQISWKLWGRLHTLHHIKSIKNKFEWIMAPFFPHMTTSTHNLWIPLRIKEIN